MRAAQMVLVGMALGVGFLAGRLAGKPAATVVATTPVATPAAPATVEPSPSPGQLAAVADAHQVIDAALASGVWTQRDAAALNAGMRDMTEAERRDVVQTVIVALNSGSVRVDFAGPPF